MGNYTDWVTGTCIKRWAERKESGSSYAFGTKYVLYGSSECKWLREFIGKRTCKDHTKNVSVIIQKEDAFIAGLSMGGYGAIEMV